MKSLLTFILLTLSFSNTLLAQSSKEELFLIAKADHQVLSYNDARKAMFNQIYLEKDSQGPFVVGVYCHDRFDLKPGDVVNGRLPNSVNLNTEHTWPQSKFSKQFSASTQKGDLHHLFPAGSKINGERGNLPFAEVNGTDRLSCSDSKRGSSKDGMSGTFFEPPDAHKGNVARAIFYFSVRYKMEIDKTQEHFLRLWHKEDPVTEEEKLQHERVVQVQKNRNPFIDHPELVDQIEDF